MNNLTALVLAGTRPGGDPLAAFANVSHKALIEVGGGTMIERVVTALAATPNVSRIVIATDRPELFTDLPGLLACRKPITTMRTAEGPSASVGAALRSEGTPLLVTTADHALLQPEWLLAFLAASATDTDATLALARREAVESAAPGTMRTYLRFSNGDYSGCNLFLLLRPSAGRLVDLWQQLEAERKRPVRMLLRLGVVYALRYVLRRLSLEQAIHRLGALAGASAAVVELADGRAAIDVDKPEDLELVRRLLAGSSSAHTQTR